MHRSLRILIILFLLAGSIFVNPVTPAYAQEISIPAQINKQFDPIAITAGDISKLSVTIYNPNTYELTDAAWTDNLVGIQPGLRIADDVNLVNTCDGVTPSTVIADPGGTTLSLSGATVPPQTGATPGECTVTVDVTSTTAGNLLNKIPENTLISTSIAGPITNSTSAAATLRVSAVQPPSLSKRFNSNTIWVGETSLLTINIINNDLKAALTKVSLTDTLPTNVVLADPVGETLTPNCGTLASVSGDPGDGTFTLNNAAIPANSTCEVTVSVTSTTPGAYTNTIPAHAIHTQQGVTNAGEAKADLNVQAVGLEKSFSKTSILAGETSLLTITLKNPTGADYTSVALTDTLPGSDLIFVDDGTALTDCGSGLLTISASKQTITLSGGTVPFGDTITPGTCTIQATVTTSISAASHTYKNEIPIGALTADGGITNAIAATADITVTAVSIGVTKSFNPTSIQAGGSSELTIRLTNPTSADFTGTFFTDYFPAGLTILDTPTASQCGGTVSVNAGADQLKLEGGIIPAHSFCTVKAQVTTPAGGPATTYLNSIPDHAIGTDQGGTNLDSASVHIGVYAEGLGVTGSKTFSPDSIIAGSNSKLTIDLYAPADRDLTVFSVTDTLPTWVTISNSIAASKNGNCAGGTLSAATGASTISWTSGTIAKGAHCQIKVYVTSSTLGVYTNTIHPEDITNFQEQTVVSDLTDDLRVSDLVISKAFYPNAINPNSLSTLTITLRNTNASPLVDVNLTDSLATMGGDASNGVFVAPTPNTSTTCPSGTVSATAGTQTITMSAGAVPAEVLGVEGICTIKVDVIGKGSATTRTNTIPIANVSGKIQGTTTIINPLQPATADLTIANLTIGIVKGFDPLKVFGGASSILTIELSNPNNVALQELAFTDNMPANMIVASPVNASVGTCGGTLSAVTGDSFFSYSGGSLPAATTCSLTLNITTNFNGNLTNVIPIGALTTINGVKNTQAAEASLTNMPGASLNKFFYPTQIGTVPGSYSTLTITIKNTGSTPLTGMGYTDTLPTNLIVAGGSAPAATNGCGGSFVAAAGSGNVHLSNGTIAGGTSCSMTVSVVSLVPGSYENCLNVGALTNNESLTNHLKTCDTLTVIHSPVNLPLGIKTLNSEDLPELEWKIVWINNANVIGIDAIASDAIPAGTTYVSGSLSCEVQGASTTTSCSFDGDKVVWTGMLAADYGATDAASANNEVVLLFKTSVAGNVGQVTNQSTIIIDRDDDGFDNDTGPESNAESNVAVWTRKLPGNIPATGFVPNTITPLLPQPLSSQYSDLGDLWIEIPNLNLQLSIVGVPLTDSGWDISWLDKEAGWLNGTAFPTLTGNSVITGHVYDANGRPGPFINLDKLRYGDQIIIHAWGQKYIYEVRQEKQISPNAVSTVTKHEDLPWLTLVTCQGYDEASHSYRYRYIVRAVQTKIK